MAQKIICHFCKAEIDAEAKICPNCKSNLANIRTNKKIFKIFGVVFAAIFAFAVFSYAFFGETEREKDAPIAETKQTELPGTPLEFSLLDDYKVIKKAATGRHRLEMTILPKSGQETATQADLISTVMHVAHEAYQRTAAPVTIVNMLAQNTGNAWADRQLAFIVYIPDQKGFDGKTASKKWENAAACERGFTADELTYLQLWGQLRTKYFDPQTGGVPQNKEEALTAEIEQVMGKKLDTDPMFNVMWPVDTK
ncbi:DUF4875 domain-containing protein [Taurinivorans muris]|uniref:DUF4875 domain-containing protein n=1 Tax=Taurinivorans muris TaxID=2787751 RepID=A0ABY5Y3G9_9BACT|nr:DUF4875 domain-containing protein [Desulfovibrionaceae bacterium LT0009]